MTQVNTPTTSGKARQEVAGELSKALQNDTPFAAFKRWEMKDRAIQL